MRRDEEEGGDDQEVEPVRRFPLWAWAVVGVWLVVLFGLIGYGVVSAAKRANVGELATAPGDELLTDNEIIRFKDNPAEFDGRTVRTRMTYGSLTPLRECVGRQPAEFHGFTSTGNTRIDVAVMLPPGLNYPNITYLENVWLEFAVSQHGTVCTLVSVGRR